MGAFLRLFTIGLSKAGPHKRFPLWAARALWKSLEMEAASIIELDMITCQLLVSLDNLAFHCILVVRISLCEA